MTRFGVGTNCGRLWFATWPGFAAMALVGSSVTVIAVTSHLPVLAIQATRYAVAGLAVLGLARTFGIRLIIPRGSDVLWVVLGSLIGLVGFTLAMILGTRHAEPALLGAAIACIPVALAVTGPLAQRQRPSLQVTVGAVIVSIGAVAVTGWGRADPTGVIMAVALIGCEAGFTLLGAQALLRMGPWGYSAATSLVAPSSSQACPSLSSAPPWPRSLLPSRSPRSSISASWLPRSASSFGSPECNAWGRERPGSARGRPRQ